MIISQKPIYRRPVTALSVCVFLLLLTSCADKHWLGWEGYLTKADNRLALESGGPHAGIWQTRDIAIQYRYVRKQDRLVITGRVARQAHLRHFHRLKAWVWIHFIDRDGHVKASRRLWAQNGSDVYAQIRYRFKREWELPPGVEALGFSYSGRAADRDVRWDFWRLP